MQKKVDCKNCKHCFSDSIPDDEYGDIIWYECELKLKCFNQEELINCNNYDE